MYGGLLTIAVAEIAKRMERLESSPLFFRIKQSGEDSPQSIRCRDPGD